MKKHIIFLIIIFFLPVLLFSQILEPVQSTWINFGAAVEEIGMLAEGENSWKPLFFSVDEKGNIHIPDFYKMRIVLFSRKGKFLKAGPCPRGISPRMNYFALAPDGEYVTFNDGTLYLLKEDGSLKWEYAFGPGTIPARIFPTPIALFLILPRAADNDGRSLVYDYSHTLPPGRFGIDDKKNKIPLVLFPGDLRFALTLQGMTTLRPFASPGIRGAEAASLLFVDSRQRSVWKLASGNSETILVYSQAGKLMNRGVINYPEGLNGTGFGTCVDAGLMVYKNYFYADHMEITGYKLDGSVK